MMHLDPGNEKGACQRPFLRKPDSISASGEQFRLVSELKSGHPDPQNQNIPATANL